MPIRPLKNSGMVNSDKCIEVDIYTVPFLLFTCFKSIIIVKEHKRSNQVLFFIYDYFSIRYNKNEG